MILGVILLNYETRSSLGQSVNIAPLPAIAADLIIDVMMMMMMMMALHPLLRDFGTLGIAIGIAVYMLT